MGETSTSSLDLITTKELAVILRKTPNAVRIMRHRGEGPVGTRHGKDVLYDRQEVRRWLAAKTAGDVLAQRAAA
ncbi:helix-turn-helix domain-containing protein [Streptomyces sp. NPDC051577]|uniref:helix-turn-helix domain-containing protein n=1 Tax=Streptomyces sp. NPDC051577 TaxID=3155166 RepID=UPI003425964B